jgi:hypothetical protein
VPLREIKIRGKVYKGPNWKNIIEFEALLDMAQ